MLTRTARYALNTLGYLVRNRGARTPGQAIARETGVPANYLSKILNLLRKNGFVDSEKGWGGGFELRADALERPIWEIVSLIEGSESHERAECLFGLPACDADNPCPLHSYWEQIRGTHQEMLSRVRIADLGS